MGDTWENVMAMFIYTKLSEDFNKQLDNFTEKNADEITFNFGNPTSILKAIGLPNKPIKLFGAKLLSKIKKYGFDSKDLKGLLEALHNPIMVLNGNDLDTFAILTEIKVNGKNVLVSIDINKQGETDINFISSIYGKNTKGIIQSINNNELIYRDIKKALKYFSNPTTIVGSKTNEGLDANIIKESTKAIEKVKEFENPKVDNTEFQVLYHGTNKIFTKFTKTKFGKREGSNKLGEGVYLSPSEDYAKQYGSIKTTVEIEDDLKIIDYDRIKYEDGYYRFLDKVIKKNDNYDRGNAKEDFARKKFDGIQYGSNEIVIFDPKNVKVISQIQFARTPNGTIYGFVKDGQVYLSEDFETKYGDILDIGGEARVYYDGNVVTKVNDLSFHDIPIQFFDRIAILNILFPESPYKVIGFTYRADTDSFSVIVQQPFIDRQRKAT